MSKLVVHSVHLPAAVSTADEVAEKAVFVKDGFSFPGFVFGGFWLLAQRLWLPAILFLLALGAVMAAFWWFALPRPAYGIVSSLMSLLVGLEGNEWLRRGLAKRGFRHVETVSGTNLADCERRFFARWLEGQTKQAQLVQAAVLPTANPVPVTETIIMPQPGIIGVFPQAGGGR